MADLTFAPHTEPPETSFSCGVSTIDRTIQNSCVLVLLHRCFAYSVKAKGILLGYYMVSLRRFPVSEFDPPISDHVVDPYEDLYALHIDYIAVHKEYQKKHIGTAILKHILNKAEEMKRICPIRLITMDALNDLIPWYEKFQFKKSNYPNTDQPSTTLMYYDMITDEEIERAEEFASY